MDGLGLKKKGLEMRRRTQLCVSVGAVLCVGFGAWAQTPSDTTDPKAAPEGVAAEQPETRKNEIVEVTRPAEAAKPLLSKEYLAKILSAHNLPPLTSVGQRASLQQTLVHLQAGNVAPAAETWTRCASELIWKSGREEVEGLILYILNESFLQSDPDLLIHGEKARFYREQERVVHEHLSALRKFKSAHASDESPDAMLESPVLSSYVPGGTAVRSIEREKVTWEEIGDRIEDWDRQRMSIEENARSADSELQRTMVKRRGKVHAISAASQMLHDVADGIPDIAPKE